MKLKSFMHLFWIFLVLIIGDVWSVKIYVKDFSSPVEAIYWREVPGENYVKHIYNKSGLTGYSEEIYTFDGDRFTSFNICQYVSNNLGNLNLKTSCLMDMNEAAYISIIVFKDSLISKEELIDFFRSINYDAEVKIFLVPYESSDYHTLNELMDKGVMNKIMEDLFRVLGREKFEEVFGIGQSIFDNGVIEVYADNFSEEEITTMFKIIRRYIPEDVRFTILLYHYVPENQPISSGQANDSSMDGKGNMVNISSNYLFYIYVAALLLIATITVLYIKSR